MLNQLTCFICPHVSATPLNGLGQWTRFKPTVARKSKFRLLITTGGSLRRPPQLNSIWKFWMAHSRLLTTLQKLETKCKRQLPYINRAWSVMLSDPTLRECIMAERCNVAQDHGMTIAFPGLMMLNYASC